MKIALLSILFLFFYRPPNNNEHFKAPSSSDSVLASLKVKKAAVDQYVYKHQKQIIVFVKLEDKKTLVRVKDENWPDKTEYIYNVLKDNSGHIIMIAQMPYSESGDWYIEYKHYFDADGKTFLFSKRGTVFDDSVKGGVAVEEALTFYDNYNTISKTKRLTDKDDNLIKRKRSEFDFREFKYSIYKDLMDCLAGYSIQIH